MTFIVLSEISGLNSGIDMQALVVDLFAAIFGTAAIAMTIVILSTLALLYYRESRRPQRVRPGVKERGLIGVKIKESADLASV